MHIGSRTFTPECQKLNVSRAQRKLNEIGENSRSCLTSSAILVHHGIWEIYWEIWGERAGPRYQMFALLVHLGI